MKIVICDDNIEDLTKTSRLLASYVRSHPNTEFEVEKFSDAFRLYNQICKKQLADIYILDMIMQQKTGIDIGRQIRQTERENMIIYISSFDDYAMEAYGVHAARYLLKPVSKIKFFEAVDYAIAHTKKKKERLYLVKTEEGLRSIPYSEITYIENSSRRLAVYLAGGEKIKSIFIRKSFDEEIKEFTEHHNFLQIHKSFLVNLNYVKKLTQNEIIMDSGIHISVSKTRAAEVKKSYLLFISEQYR